MIFYKLPKLSIVSFEKLTLTHVFRSCCSGIDPTMPQWEKIAEVCKKKNHFPLFDLAYLGKSMGLTTLTRLKSTSSRERFYLFSSYLQDICSSYI